MLKVGIIGCGKIADAHANLIMRIPGCEIVGVCDKEELMAKQLYERFPIKNYYNDVNQLIAEAHPDVVHITTSPQSHFPLGKMCLEAGCHVYLEKPFTVNTTEARALIQLAIEKKQKITAGHNEQFSYVTRKMRELISEGYLGGKPVHMESYYCYDLGNESYAKSLLGDKNHWVRLLPGTLMQNNISHGISRVAEYIDTDDPIVIAHGFTSSLLKNIHEENIIDEVRVIISDHKSTTAYFTFSTQMRPTMRHFRVYGTKNALFVDHDHQTLLKVQGAKYKSYLDKFVPPYLYAKQYAANSLLNIMRFIKKELHMDEGMRFLIESFYQSIIEDAPLPISYREIILTSKIMDDIFVQLNSEKAGFQSNQGDVIN